MSAKPVAVLVESVHAAADAPLREAGFDVQRLSASPDAATLRSLLSQATVFGLRSKTRLVADALAAAGYSVLTRSPEIGVDTCIKSLLNGVDSDLFN